MPTYIPTPYAATLSKTLAGTSDTSVSDHVYKFLGCSVLSANMSLGFNGIPSSLSVSLVEDTVNGDNFTEPQIPSLHAFSLPKGGVGAPIFYDSFSFNQENFDGDNVPLYFCGICTNFSQDQRNISGKTISVSLVDPREILSGIQCLLGEFSLSQNFGASAPRFASVDNVIDVFGYYNHGLEANRNEYGMLWSDIQTVLENVRVRINNIYFEFTFTGDIFNATPSFYRINEEMIDLMGLVQKVTQDSGSDLIVIARKASSNEVLVEFRGIKRLCMNPLTQDDIDNFVSTRDTIIDTVKKGKEYRNEPVGSVLFGGFKNTNYVAWPSSYDESMHLTSGKEDYNAFPSDIKARLFGGNATIYDDNNFGDNVTTSTKNFDISAGAIIPFWGFTPDDFAIPLIEPFLPLDHLVFDKVAGGFNMASGIPCCKISVQNYTVREVVHTDVFLDGDGDPDSRPFAYLEEYLVAQTSKPDGYIRGLPLNTEVLRAALADEYSFWDIYKLHYPDVADNLGISGFDTKVLYQRVVESLKHGNLNLSRINIQDLFYRDKIIDKELGILVHDEFGKILKNDSALQNAKQFFGAFQSMRWILQKLIYEMVKKYAEEHMGRKFLVCLPRSEIMYRIWNDLSVPTRPEKPKIEYEVAQYGYWENIPSEFDGLTASGTMSADEDQIRRKFMEIDGRFSPMVIIDSYPSGNMNFNAYGQKAALFQSMSPSDFRPNRIAESTPNYVCVNTSVTQLTKRPDLALVEIPAIYIDPTDSYMPLYYDETDDENIATRAGVIKYLWYFIKRDNNLRDSIKRVATALGSSFISVATATVNDWARNIAINYSQPYKRSMSTELLMDLKAVIIPLTSNWVSYGPWYNTYNAASGMCKIEVDSELVPWNFERPDPPAAWDANLAVAGLERLQQSYSDVDYLDSATITVAGFPEYGLGSNLGYNNNLTTISIDFGIGAVKTTYNFATYSSRPGTFRKNEYDNISKARIDTREQLSMPTNLNLLAEWLGQGYYGTNKFP